MGSEPKLTRDQAEAIAILAAERGKVVPRDARPLSADGKIGRICQLFSIWPNQLLRQKSGRSILPAGHLLTNAKTRLQKLKSLCRNSLPPPPPCQSGIYSTKSSSLTGASSVPSTEHIFPIVFNWTPPASVILRTWLKYCRCQPSASARLVSVLKPLNTRYRAISSVFILIIFSISKKYTK